MELADERGIESLTMRALGRRLGVEAASLYNHVTGKEDLLDGITDLVVGEIDVPTRAADWASGLIDSRGQMGPARLAYVDGVLGVLLGAGFSAEAAANAFMALESYIYGFERQRTELNLGEGRADTTAAARSVQMAASPEAYPSLERVAGEFATRPYDVAASFEFGLGLILDGLERLMASGGSADSRAVR